MRTPLHLSEAFGAPFQELISRFATSQGLMPEPGSIGSSRFLSRSVIPHVRKLSALFNREDAKVEQGEGLDPYWKESSNPLNLRLAYFLYFMPSNLYRVASAWAELSRLGFRWSAQGPLRAIEFGAGPAAGATGIAAGERHAPCGLPGSGDWALIEQDKAMLELGSKWSREYFDAQELKDWGTRVFHRKIDLKQGFLPRTAPRFNLWVMSYFLNEFTQPASEIAQALASAWERHLDEEGVAVIIEPALKLQSRRLLEIRRELLKLRESRGYDWLQVLLPCLGHQACGALAAPEDWCHEDVSWWRPPYFRAIDQMAGLDRKTLPFSYLVVARSRRAREELLPGISGFAAGERFRLVSPAHAEGKEREFFVCGQEGKSRARYKPRGDEDPGKDLERGDILLGAGIRGDARSARIERIKKIR